MSLVAEFLGKTLAIAAFSGANAGINIYAGKAIDSKMQPKIPERTAEMTDQQYLEVLEKADKKFKIKKNVCKGAVAAGSLIGTSVAASAVVDHIGGSSGSSTGNTETTTDDNADAFAFF